MNMNLIVLGPVGSDAGYWRYENGRWVHHGGWGPEVFAEVNRAVRVIAETPAFKTPGLADAVTKHLADFLGKELGGHLNAKDATIVIVHSGR